MQQSAAALRVPGTVRARRAPSLAPHLVAGTCLYIRLLRWSTPHGVAGAGRPSSPRARPLFVGWRARTSLSRRIGQGRHRTRGRATYPCSYRCTYVLYHAYPYICRSGSTRIIRVTIIGGKLYPSVHRSHMRRARRERGRVRRSSTQQLPKHMHASPIPIRCIVLTIKRHYPCKSAMRSDGHT
jgi:hypothetical protein